MSVNKKKLVLAVGIILLLGLIGLGRNLWPQKKDPAALKIETTPQATVFFNDNNVGQTPYSVQNLPPGPLSVKLATDNQNWSTKVNLTSGAWTIIRRDFGATEASSSGEILSLEKGTGLIIISAPDKASVVIDGQSVGETPLVLKDLKTGDHQVDLSKDSYLPRTINLKVIAGYQLTVSAQLALGVNIADQASPSAGLTSEKKQATIKETGTGWLRLRTLPSLSGQEIAKVDVGTIVSVLEEKVDWIKISLSDGKQGWVSSQFVQKN